MDAAAEEPADRPLSLLYPYPCMVAAHNNPCEAMDGFMIIINIRETRVQVAVRLGLLGHRQSTDLVSGLPRGGGGPWPGPPTPGALSRLSRREARREVVAMMDDGSRRQQRFYTLRGAGLIHLLSTSEGRDSPVSLLRSVLRRRSAPLGVGWGRTGPQRAGALPQGLAETECQWRYSGERTMPQEGPGLVTMSAGPEEDCK